MSNYRNDPSFPGSYLEYSSFSRSSLIAQLEFEGFTPAQAEYGANAAGL